MSPADAATVLGVSPGASAAAIESAYRRLARQVHPDLFVTEPPVARGEGDRFIEVAEARRVLLEQTGGQEPVGEFVSIPHPVSPVRIVTWAAVALLAAFVAIFGTAAPFGTVELLVRWTLIIVVLVAFASTGRTVWLVVAAIMLGATAITTVIFSSFGAMLGLFILSAPAIALVVIGRSKALRMRLLAQAAAGL